MKDYEEFVPKKGTAKLYLHAIAYFLENERYF